MSLKAKDVYRIVGELKEHYSLLNSLRSSLDHTAAKRALQRLRGKGRIGRKLATLGISLILFPEPTMVSDVIGSSLLLLGKKIDKAYASIGISDVIKTSSDVLKNLGLALYNSP
ncbi:MAG: hypothetical protein QW815_01605 [Nitrososphaerota archaeon]